MKMRIKFISVLVFVTLLLYVPFAWSNRPQQGQWESGGLANEEQFALEFVPGEVLVKFEQWAPKVEMQALHSYLQAEEIMQIEPIGVILTKLPPDISVEEAVAHYETDPNVKYAEPNYILQYTAMPNDSDFNKLWGLHNTGRDVNGVPGTLDADIDAPEAWDLTTGSDNVIIAVVDSGVAFRHPEIEPNIWINNAEMNGTDGVDDDGNGKIDDNYGWDFYADDKNPEDYTSHGTHVAGIIAARGNNQAAITGVNWNAKIMALRNGGNRGPVTSASIEAIMYAVKNGVHIINASWGGPNYSQSTYEAIEYADKNGVLFVTTAGNGGPHRKGDDNDQTPQYPASYELPNIIAVAATDQDDNLTEFSNYGATSVDVAAPGINVYSTIPEFTRGTRFDLYEEDFDPSPSGWVVGGTNFSWAFVAGTGDGGTNCLEDSPTGNYLNNTNSIAGYTGSGTPFSSVKDNYYTLSFRLKMALENNYDRLYLASSENGTTWSRESYYFTGTTSAFVNAFFDLTSLAERLSEFYFGFWLYSNASVTQDGVYIDNLELYREPIVINDYSYDYYGGTSMASPMVAGVAGLVKAINPSLTHLEIRQIILDTVDVKSSLDGKLVTEGRVNAFNAVKAAGPQPEPLPEPLPEPQPEPVVSSNGGGGG